MKKILILIVILLVVSGSVYFITNKEPQEEGFKDTVLERNQARSFQSDNFSTGTPEDLVVGEEVVVRGTTNQDGSITAIMILIGTLEGMPEFSPDTERDFSNRPMPERFDSEEFGNLSQEERLNHMQELRGGMVRRNSGAGFVRGEIIDKDEMSITVKLVDSGSKLVFYSDNTQIRKLESD